MPSQCLNVCLRQVCQQISFRYCKQTDQITCSHVTSNISTRIFGHIFTSWHMSVHVIGQSFLDWHWCYSCVNQLCVQSVKYNVHFIYTELEQINTLFPLQVILVEQFLYFISMGRYLPNWLRWHWPIGWNRGISAIAAVYKQESGDTILYNNNNSQIKHLHQLSDKLSF